MSQTNSPELERFREAQCLIDSLSSNNALLRELNSYLVDVIKFNGRVKNEALKRNFRVGQEVFFDRRGRHAFGTMRVSGRIIRMSRSRAVVEENTIAAANWNVPYEMLKPAEENELKRA